MSPGDFPEPPPPRPEIPLATPLASEVPNPVRVIDWIQLGCIRFSSAVSSMDTILYSGGIKLHSTLRNVVLPVAVPPDTRIERLYSIRIHMNASCWASIDP